MGPEGRSDGGYADVERLGKMAQARHKTQDTRRCPQSQEVIQFWQLKDDCIEGWRRQDCE